MLDSPQDGRRPVTAILDALGRAGMPAHDRRFWLIQALVLVIVVTHLLLEREPHLVAESEFYLLSVSIFLLPVVYAGMRFGVSGALPTTIWALLLSAPEIYAHESGTRVGILVQFGIIFSIALIVGLRVDGERAASAETTRANARLSRLNATASAVAQSLNLEQVLDETLRAKLDRTTRQIAWIMLEPGPTVIAANRVAVPAELDPVQRALALAACRTGRVQREAGLGLDARSAAAPIVSGEIVVGALGVTYLNEPIPPDEYRVLEGIGTQLGTALSNIHHHTSTREALAALSNANKNLEIYIELATEAQEEERKRLSRELHDDTMQSLVVTLAQIDSATTSDLPDTARARLAVAQAILAETLDNLRRYCRNLRPSLIDDLGLVDAIDWLVGDLRSRVGTTVVLECTGPQSRLRSRDELLVFRVVQEALHNVERHAEASVARVSLHFTDGDLVVEVADDGRGSIAIGRGTPRGSVHLGLGLRGMRERANLLKGTLAIESSPGRGTTIRLAVPLVVGSPVPVASGAHFQTESRNPISGR